METAKNSLRNIRSILADLSSDEFADEFRRGLPFRLLAPSKRGCQTVAVDGNRL
jgi:hypothetical protein